MTRGAKAMTGAANFIAMFNFSTSVTNTCCHNTILMSEICAARISTETFLKTATLFVLVWVYPCEMKTSDENFKNPAILLQ